MHFHVVGYGAIGSLVAHHLRAALGRQHPISFVHRSPSIALTCTEAAGNVRLEHSGVVTTSNGFLHESTDPYDDLVYRRLEAERRQRHLKHLPEPVRKEKLADLPPHLAVPSQIDSLIVATKAPVAVRAIEGLLPRLSASSTIVLLHNGMGVYEELIGRVFRNREMSPHIVVSVNNHGAFLKEPGHVVHTGVGDIMLGIMPDGQGRDFEASLDTSLLREDQKLSLDDITSGADDYKSSRYLSLRNTIAALTSITPLNITWRPLYDVQVSMRRKLVVNSVINPLTALLNCPNGEIFEHAAGPRICRRLCQEASDIFRKQWSKELDRSGRPLKPFRAGDDVYDAPDTPVDDSQFPRELELEGLVSECKRVARVTQGNVSSMLVDVRRGKSTEIKYINGYLFALAMRYNIPAPATSTILDLMRLRSAIPLDRAVPTNSIL